MGIDIKKANPNNSINALLQLRWSPYVFSNKPVHEKDLICLFEAARWAPSSYNEQPWRYIVARKDNEQQFNRMLSCLVEGNQAWAKEAPVLAIGIVMTHLTQSGKPNRAAQHDLGAASMSLSFEATEVGLHVHQMIGIEPEKVREIYNLPQGAEAHTGLAIGYVGDKESSVAAFNTRDATARTRKPMSEIIFSDSWGQAADFI